MGDCESGESVSHYSKVILTYNTQISHWIPINNELSWINPSWPHQFNFSLKIHAWKIQHPTPIEIKFICHNFRRITQHIRVFKRNLNNWGWRDATMVRVKNPSFLFIKTHPRMNNSSLPLPRIHGRLELLFDSLGCVFASSTPFFS